MRLFSIRDRNNHSVVGGHIIDLKIHETFNLEHIDYMGRTERYCHYYFDDLEDSRSHFQKSISWTGLIDTIIYYSEVPFGSATRYDLEAALEYVRLHSVSFPKSASRFLSDMLAMLYEMGYYIFVEDHSKYEESTDIFQGEDKSINLMVTSKGICYCSSEGELVDFIPTFCRKYEYKPKLPPMIKKISTEFYCNMVIRRRLPKDISDWIMGEVAERQRAERQTISNLDDELIKIQTHCLEDNEDIGRNEDGIEEEKIEKFEVPFGATDNSENVRKPSIWKRILNFITKK